MLALACSRTRRAAARRGERLVASLSNHRVMITSNFTGAELVLFGAVEQDARRGRARGGYDIVVTVTGPRETMVTFRKERVLGIWVNADSRTFENAPSYLAVLSNRPIDAITNTETLRRLQIGLDDTFRCRSAPASTSPTPRATIRSALAFLRLKSDHGLYREEPNGVTFLTPALFRAAIPLPAEVPVGTYEVDVKLFADGAHDRARADSRSRSSRSGFEQIVANAARDHGLLYGLATAMMALLTGWFARVVFRRD